MPEPRLQHRIVLAEVIRLLEELALLRRNSIVRLARGFATDPTRRRGRVYRRS